MEPSTMYGWQSPQHVRLRQMRKNMLTLSLPLFQPPIVPRQSTPFHWNGPSL